MIPLSWDEDGVTECAFIIRGFYRGKAVDLTFDVLINELDLSKEFAPALRTNGQIEAFRVALQMLGNLTEQETKGVTSNDVNTEAEKYLMRYAAINKRASLILELSFLARQVRLRYNGDMSSRRIDLD